MLSASRSWLYMPNLRRLYTTPTTQPVLNPTRMPKTYGLPKISTLRPEKLVHSDFLVFSGRVRSSFHTKLSLSTPVHAQREKNTPDIQTTKLEYRTCTVDMPESGEDKVESEGGGAETTASTEGGGVKRRTEVVHVPFPESAQGFLYLHQPPPDSGLPRSACSLRFRCAPSLVEASKGIEPQSVRGDGPLVHLPSSITNREIYEAFKAGYDLTLPNNALWKFSVAKVAGRPYLQYVRKQLVEDELFSESEMQECEELYKSTNSSRKYNLLRDLGDVFILQFNSPKFMVWNAAGKAVRTGDAGQAAQEQRARIKPRSSVLKNAFVDQRVVRGNNMPYTGAARVRFELAPGSDASNPALSLRIIEIIQSAKCVISGYDRYVHMPKEGELVMLGPPDKAEPWICQIDPSKYTESAILSLVPGYVVNAQLR